MPFQKHLATILVLVAFIGSAGAKDFYVDPSNGSMNNDGSYERPWKTIQEVFEKGLIEMQVCEQVNPCQPFEEPMKYINPGAPVKAGDTIYLRDGYHGEIWIRGAYNSDYITIAAQDGHKPKLRGIQLSAASKWIIRGLTISPELAPTYQPTTLIKLENHGWHGPSFDIIIEDNNLYSVQDTSSWTAADWNEKFCTGINAAARNSVVRNNTLKNVNFGISPVGENGLVEYNYIENIAGDGIVFGDNNVTIQYNIMKNFYKVNGNHDDGIQSHRGTNPDRIPVKNAVLRGNIIISKDIGVTNPLVGSPQGIGAFDQGIYQNWLVENNVVLVQHYHGISIYGCQGCTIVNNIAFDPTGSIPAWISLNNAGNNTIVRNNMSRSYSIGGTNMNTSNNLNIGDYDPAELFLDYKNLDVRHKPGSPAIDAGSPELAPNVDIEGNPRPQGAGFDIGAYEYVPSTFLYGDVSGDNQITAYDAALAAHIAVGLSNPDIKSTAAAEVSGDGKVTAYDAALIAQRAEGIINKFPIE